MGDEPTIKINGSRNENESEMTPNRELAIDIVSEFEELLEELDITLPSSDREVFNKRTGTEARIYGDHYWHLEDKITDMLEGKLK